MAVKKPDSQMDLFDDWLVAEPPAAHIIDSLKAKKTQHVDNPRHVLAQTLASQLIAGQTITSKSLTAAADIAFGGKQNEGTYSGKDSYDALEAAFNLYLLETEGANWTELTATAAKGKIETLIGQVKQLPTQSRRDEEMDEYQQFSTPPALAFAAAWAANIQSTDTVMEPSAGTGDLAVWAKAAKAQLVLNELAPRRHELLGTLFPDARLFKENAEQLDNILPSDVKPTVVLMNPPFTSTAGRVQGERDSFNGARHIEQALKRLDPGGRLVAITGNGMADDKAAFKEWWSGIKDKYTVRANIGLSGKEYSKYGTTFDNQLLIIDKTGPTRQSVVTGYLESAAEIPALVEGIRNDRQSTQSVADQSTSIADTKPVLDTVRPKQPVSDSVLDTVGPGAESNTSSNLTGAGVADSQVDGRSSIGDVANDGNRARGQLRDNLAGRPGGSSGGDLGGNTGDITGIDTGLVIESIQTRAEFSHSVFANYTPQRLSIRGAKAHPGKLVQSAAMSAVEPPLPSYTPTLPKAVIDDGLLSIAQLEAVVYAGQAHSQRMPSGERKGFFIGDGTGVGKGREISGILLDNWLQGQTKAVWVSFNEGLVNDAKRDYAGVGGNPDLIFFQGKIKAGDTIKADEGILFTTYSTLRGGEKKQANDLGQTGGKNRISQIIEWLGDDFNGVIAFDEAHSMGNAIAVKNQRGTSKPSMQAVAGINLQKALPDAKVVYVSATGATEISNLSYAHRLGLWGEGSAFSDVNKFISDVSRGGLASMELISRDMKALGVYMARSLSYDGVTYERLEHQLSELQEDIYNEMAEAWQVVLNNVDQALEITNTDSSAQGKSAVLAQFWGAQQRFFNQVITAMQTPSVIDDIAKQLEAGHAVVIQLVNTNEAAQERILADAAANNIALEELDFTPRQMLMDYVRHGFPVVAYERTLDDGGNITFVPSKDSNGNPVFDREAIELRDNLLNTLQQIRVPENPLDSIINAFGSERVAEVTGRSRRFVQERDDNGEIVVKEEKRGKHAARSDAAAFQDDKKDILIFSGAGGTGYSFHADNAAINQRKRVHYILQPGWQANAAVQGFGRTHRTNQAQEPHYVLPTTNLKAQKRFISSIARRLDQLGALTRGQRDTTSQGLLTAADNLESEYASMSLRVLFVDLYNNKTPLSFNEVTKQMGLNLFDHEGKFNEYRIPNVPQFLNRLLSLKTDMQNAVFDAFEQRLIDTVAYAKQQGIYDEGLQTIKAKAISKISDTVVFQDKATGAATRYIELGVTNDIQYDDWASVKQYEDRRNVKAASSENKPENDLSGWFMRESGKQKGQVFYLRDVGKRVDLNENPVHRGAIHTIRSGDFRYVDNADTLARGWDYRLVGNRSEKVTLTRKISAEEAQILWNKELNEAPPTETKIQRMLVGAILPIWDRVTGSEKIIRLQTDDNEQLIGRLLDKKSSQETLKNLGVTDSNLAGKSASDVLMAIRSGEKAILSNGWEISAAKVNFEDRLEIKAKGHFTEGDKRILKDQGAFIERINWQERVFIPNNNETGVSVFERVTASKPVVDLIGKKQTGVNAQNDSDDDALGYGIAELSTNHTEAVQPVPIVSKEANSGQSEVANSTQSSTQRKEVQPMADTEKTKKPFHVAVADKLIEQLEQGVAPWQKPWSETQALLPFNPVTGNRYKGVNSVLLLSEDREDARWLTYKQAQSLGAQVRKGEKGTGIAYWQFTEERPRLNDKGKPELDNNGDPIKDTVTLARPRAFYATVFNAEQIDGLPALIKPELAWNPVERAEALINNSGAIIKHKPGDKAFYRPSTDDITCPERHQFADEKAYYATVIHELGHWTGHESRLNRDIKNPFGSEAYAREELRAEIASLILGSELGIGHDGGQHAAYVKSWIKVLKDDPAEILRAAADAEKIQKYLLAFEQSLEHTTDNKPVEEVTREDNLVSTQFNEYDMALKRAINAEINAKQNPDSTPEDIIKAREVRKTAELEATINEPAFQQKLTELRNQTQAMAGSGDLAADQKQAKQYLAVPYKERQAAKAAGALWDADVKSWYVGPTGYLDRLAKWLPDNITAKQTPAVSPQEEFAKVLTALNLVVSGEHPIFDGKKHRIPAIDDKKGGLSGYYVAYADGNPAGYAKNFRTDEDLRWAAKGYNLSSDLKAALTAQATVKRAERDQEQAIKHKDVAAKLGQLLAVSDPAPSDHAYLRAKHARGGSLRVVPDSSTVNIEGVLIANNYKDNKARREANPEALVFTTGDLLVPAYDTLGQLKTVQVIQAGGSKYFATGSEKAGAFHVVGSDDCGIAVLRDSPVIVVSEGYATADTVSRALGVPVVSAFDATNLKAVSEALHTSFPEKILVIAGDDDVHLEYKLGKNVGSEKAVEAAQAVGGTAVFPVFAPGEQTYPAELERVTPSNYKSGKVTNEQLQALDNIKGFKDFNDLAEKSELGLEGVKRQLVPIVNELIEQQERNSIQLKEEQKEKLVQEKQHRRGFSRI